MPIFSFIQQSKGFRFAIALVIAFVASISSGCSDGEGVTPLMKASHAGDVQKLKALLSDSAHVDTTSAHGWTALMFAAWQGHSEVVRLLLDAGADPNIISEMVPSRFETTLGHPPTTALREALRSGHLDIAGLLLDAGAEVDAEAAALAAGLGDIKLLERLRKASVDFNLASGNAFDASPLCSAAGRGKVDVVKWLVEHGADVNRIAVGQTPLKEAISADNVEIVSYLLEQGADPDLMSGPLPESPLFHAVTKHTEEEVYANNLAIIKLLLEHRANVNLKVWDGDATSLEIVKSQRKNTKVLLSPELSQDVYRRLQNALSHKDAVIKLLESATLKPDPSD